MDSRRRLDLKQQRSFHTESHNTEMAVVFDRRRSIPHGPWAALATFWRYLSSVLERTNPYTTRQMGFHNVYLFRYISRPTCIEYLFDTCPFGQFVLLLPCRLSQYTILEYSTYSTEVQLQKNDALREEGVLRRLVRVSRSNRPRFEDGVFLFSGGAGRSS